MPLNIDITRDPYFKRGELRGEKRRGEISALSMLKDGDLPDEKIAKYSGLTLAEIEELKKRLRN